MPLGFAMWLSHYSFHFLTSYDGLIPATQRFLVDWGWSTAVPDWVCSCCRTTPEWLLRLEIVPLGIGYLFSLYTAYQIASPEQRVFRGWLPWAVLLTVLYLLGVWIVLP